MIRIGVIGAGAHSRAHHGAALRHIRLADPGSVELAAVCDLDPAQAETYAREFGFARTYTDWRPMVQRERLDGLIAVTPLAITATLAAELLPLGLPLVIEKPPGRTVADAQALADLARRHNTPHIVSLNRRFCPALRIAARWRADHAAGRPIRAASAAMYRAARREADFVTWTAIHAVDALLSLTAPPARVTARRVPHSSAPAAHFDAQVELSDGAVAHIRISPDCGVVEECYELIGDEYRIRFDALSGRVTIHDRGALALDASPAPDAPAVEVSGALDETRAFLSAIRGQAPFAPTLDDAIRSMSLAEAIAGSP